MKILVNHTQKTHTRYEPESSRQLSLLRCAGIGINNKKPDNSNVRTIYTDYAQ